MEDGIEIPDTGAVFTFGKSRFADNTPSHFFVRRDPIVDLSCGDEHTVVVCKKGRAFSFGRNAFGELGLGSRCAVGRPNCIKSLKPAKIVHVASGRAHTLFLTDDGRMYSCGNNDEGQLGHGDNIDREIPELIQIDQNIKQLSAGFKHSTALTGQGKVYVWGDNAEGQLGLGDDNISTVNSPTLLNFEFTVVQISCGYYHTLLLTDEGKVYAYGEGENGKLGLGDESNCSYPKCVEINAIASYISAGGNHSCCLTRDGKLYLWGSNDHGQLGLKDIQSISTPSLLQFDQTIVFVSLGDNHTAIVTDNGELFTFGDNRHGKLAFDKSDEPIQRTYEPTKVKKFKNFLVTKVSCGGCHTMVLAVPKVQSGNLVPNNRNKAWEIYDVSSSASSSKASLPPINRFVPTASSSPVPTPPSFSPNALIKNPTSSTSSLLDNLPSVLSPDEFDENSINGEANGNYFELKPESPKISKSCSNLAENVSFYVPRSKSCESVKISKPSFQRKVNFYKSNKILSKYKNNPELCKSFENWIQKHKEDMFQLTGQICNASRNLMEVMKNVENYFKSNECIKKSNCDCDRTKDFCARCSWAELSTETLSPPQSPIRPDTGISYNSYVKDEQGNNFSCEERNKLFWLKNDEMMRIVSRNKDFNTFFNCASGDGPQVNLYLNSIEPNERNINDLVEGGAGEGRNYENHNFQDIQESKDTIQKEESNKDSTSSSDRKKRSRLFSIIKRSPSEQKSFLVNDFCGKNSSNGQSVQNKKSKMCVIV